MTAIQYLVIDVLRAIMTEVTDITLIISPKVN